MAEVSVLVAAYNSAPYIGELLSSVLSGGFRGIEVLVRDDGSGDDTVGLAKAAAGGDRRVRFLAKRGAARGAKSNFFALLLESKSEYAMFCDADDVWMPDKIEKTLALMKRTERACGDGTPVLVHTDLAVADETLTVIAPSLFAYEKLSPGRNAFKQLLSQNNVTGCTVMVNRALREMVQAEPEQAVMHDWWLALAAAAFGKIAALPEATILYRQHGGNAVGAYDARNPAAALARFRNRERAREIYDAMFRQADAFAELYRDRLTPRQYADAKAYGGMQNLKKPGKIARMIRYGFYKNTFVRNIGQFLFI